MASEESRDFRSTSQAAKRDKTHKEKWALGTRPLSGVKLTYKWNPDMTLEHYQTGSESQQAKVRPQKVTDTSHWPSQNFGKPSRNKKQWYIPQSHSRARCDALLELKDPSNTSRSIHDLMPSPDVQRSYDGFLYSFDRNDTPGKPLALDAFVKTNPRDTEKLIEKEYEVLDNNGDALKGRKARQNLRRRNQSPSPQEAEIVHEDDGFELI